MAVFFLSGCSSGVENEFFTDYGIKDGDVIRVEITGPSDESQWSGEQKQNTASLDTGTTIQTSLTGYDAAGNSVKTLDATWTSSNPQVASVDSAGNIAALSAGETEITVKLISKDTGQVTSDTIVVTVLPSPVTDAKWNLLKSKLPQSIWDHGSAIWNGYLYVAGGHSGCSADRTDCGFTNKIYYTKINKDNNSIGTFSQTTLPAYFSGGLRGHSLLAYNGYLYILGGIVHPTFVEPPFPDTATFKTILNERVYYARISPVDGSLGAWVETTPLPPAENIIPPIAADKAGLFALSATVHTISRDGKKRGYIYVTGGWSAELVKNVNTVLVGPINDNNDMPGALPGSIPNWIHDAESDLPYDLSKHTSVAASVNGSDYLYVIGGNSGDIGTQTYHKEIMFAKIAKDGILSKSSKDGIMSTWHYASSSLPEQLIDHATVSTGGHIFVLGGRNSDDISDEVENYRKFKEVYFFRIDDTGDLKQLQRWADLPEPLFHHAAVADINMTDASINIYVTGGAGGNTNEQTNRKNTVYNITATP